MTDITSPQKEAPSLDPRKFRDPDFTAGGERRAAIALGTPATLWVNTGTLCNLTCRNCYIESSPTNDRLVYISAAEVAAYFDEIAALGWPMREIGFTGGEPFMNPEFVPMLGDALERGFSALVLTNAMRPMMKCAESLLDLRRRFGGRLTIRVSIDHYTEALHELERGAQSWQPAIDGLLWLAANGFTVNVAGRTKSGAMLKEPRTAYSGLAFWRRRPNIDLDTPEYRGRFVFLQIRFLLFLQRRRYAEVH